MNLSLSQNAGDIVVMGGKLFLGGQHIPQFTQWTDSGLITTVSAATDVLGSGVISAGGTMSIRGGSLSGLGHRWRTTANLNSATRALTFRP